MKDKLCLTSVIQISPKIIENISRFLNQYNKNSNGLHYYRPENPHITLLGLIPMSNNIYVSNENKDLLKMIFNKVLNKIKKPIYLQLADFGKTASSLYIKGRDKEGTLSIIRKNLIDEIQESPLKLDENHICSYDSSYAWCTIVRFNRPGADIDEIIGSKTTFFGSFEVQKISIVITDKKYSKENIQKLFSIKVNPS